MKFHPSAAPHRPFSPWLCPYLCWAASFPHHSMLAGDQLAPCTAWPEHFHSHCQSIIVSIRGSRKQCGSRCTLLPCLPPGFPCQPRADTFALITTSTSL